jgi:hypothetical protein
MFRPLISAILGERLASFVCVCVCVHTYIYIYTHTYIPTYIDVWAWGSVVVKALVGGSRDRSPVVSLEIFSEATDGTMCPGVDSASKNEYQENSWR